VTPAPALRSPASARLVAIGDLHGDLEAAQAALQLGGAIDAQGKWSGGKLIVVQTGDQLDRGDDERGILELFERLRREAQAAGGQVVPLNGNHETMNVQGDFRYVTPAGLTAFSGLSLRSPYAAAAPEPFRQRAEAFLPGGQYARVLGTRDVIAVVGDSVFVHGGVLPEHVDYGIERLNRETRAWMNGEAAPPALISAERAPIWVRDYSSEPVGAAACESLSRVLAALGVRRMVVGHTVQKAGISAACDGRVYRIDVGLSRYYGDAPIQVLELDGERVRVLSAARSSSSVAPRSLPAAKRPAGATAPAPP
jgi:calcineurin-like phosphoesterase family protein